MIKILKSPTADTRTCDVKEVTKEQLKNSSYLHIADVKSAMAFFQEKLMKAAEIHDHTKISGLDRFYNDFKTEFKEHTWYDWHKKSERHHIADKDGLKSDVDLIDVLEYIADCVMAGMARSGDVYDLELPNEVLQKAFKNTVGKLKEEVSIDE